MVDIMRGLRVRLQMGKYLFLHRDKAWHSSIALVHKFMNKHIDDTIEEVRQIKMTGRKTLPANERTDLLWDMAQHVEDRETLRSQITAVWVPSNDTTSILISNAFYYIRNVLHGDPDEKCVEILKQVLPVMNKDSRLLIDDIVLPNEGVHWQAAQMDLIMMASMGSKKRTQDQWQALLDASGFKILDVYTYSWPLQDSVIVAVPK